MTEHSHKAAHNEDSPFKRLFGREGAPYLLVAASILAGSLLVAGAVLYNTKVMMDNLGPAQRLAAEGGSGSAAEAAGQPEAAAEVAEIPERKNAPQIGSDKAKVTMVEFSDFQCPFCAKFFKESYGAIKSKYIDTGKVRLVFRHFPLGFHQNAQKAAEAAECAARQGKFAEYHDILFAKGQSNGTGLAVEDLKKYADDLGLNRGTLGFKQNQFNQCLDSGEAAAAVKQDFEEASRGGVSGTPTFFINGKKVVGAQPLAAFEAAIEEALGN